MAALSRHMFANQEYDNQALRDESEFKNSD